MGRRRILTTQQIAQLFDPPSDRRGLIRRDRGNHHRLGLVGLVGLALMLFYLRFLGWPLRAGERAEPAMVAFVADQLDVLPKSHLD